MNQNQYIERLFRSSYDLCKSFDELHNYNRMCVYGNSNNNKLKNAFDMAKSFSEYINASRHITPNNINNAVGAVLWGRILKNVQN